MCPSLPLSLLLNFRVLNQLAFAKLLARHDRIAGVPWRGASAVFMPVISRAPFYASEQLPELMLKIEVHSMGDFGRACIRIVGLTGKKGDCYS